MIIFYSFQLNFLLIFRRIFLLIFSFFQPVIFRIFPFLEFYKFLKIFSFFNFNFFPIFYLIFTNLSLNSMKSLNFSLFKNISLSLFFSLFLNLLACLFQYLYLSFSHTHTLWKITSFSPNQKKILKLKKKTSPNFLSSQKILSQISQKLFLYF